MFRELLLSSIVIASILLSVHGVSADKTIRCGDMKWTDKGHDDNNPSVSKFKHMAYHASLCELAKCVDHAECANHVSVDWNKFQKAPAYVNSDEETQKELSQAHEKGHGMDGLGGYEILEYVVKDG